MDQRGLPCSGCDFSARSCAPRPAREIGVLVNSTGNLVRHVGCGPHFDSRDPERRREAGCGLDSEPSSLDRFELPSKPKAARCRVRDRLPSFYNVRVHVAHVVAIAEDEGFI